VSDAETELAAALAALASDDDEGALEALVAAWGNCRAEPLIALVDVLASRIEPRHKALGGKTAEERYQAFRATAANVRQSDLARLLAMLPRLAYDDISTALDTLLYDWRYTPRMRALLESVRLTGYGDRLEELRTVHAAPRDAALSEREHAIIGELERLLAPDDAGADRLTQVYAEPDADAPRLVYADWATSRGDPRGELITLQFARRERPPADVAVRRERELLDQYMQRWLAPIWSAIRPYSVRFERGFLSTVTVEPFAVISPRPEWATVTSLELAYHEALPIDAFPALRELRNVTPQLLPQIAVEPSKLVHLGLAPEPRTDPMLTIRRPDLDGDAFPALRSLGVWGDPLNWTWLWDTKVGRQITALEVTQPWAGASPWLDGGLPPWLTEVRIRERTNEARFAREGLTYPKMDIICREPARDLLAWTHMLMYVPPYTLRTVRFVIPRRPKAETIHRLEHATRNGHPGLETFTVDVDPFV
jgi:uncharacterized protein (TIGR02996 family)